MKGYHNFIVTYTNSEDSGSDLPYPPEITMDKKNINITWRKMFVIIMTNKNLAQYLYTTKKRKSAFWSFKHDGISKFSVDYNGVLDLINIIFHLTFHGVFENERWC